MYQRALLAGIPAVVLALLLAGPGQAIQQDRNQNRSEERDGPSRNEAGRLAYIPLRTENGEVRINQIVIIQTRFVHVVDTSGTPDGFGVDFENLNKIDVSDIPLLGSVMGRSVSADDFTEDNRVGSVYAAGKNTLATVVDDSVNVSDLKVSVVNGDGRFQLLVEPRLVEVAPQGLGEFGELDVVREFMNRTATPQNTIILAGITKSKAPEVESQVPWLKDIPLLQRLFKGGSYTKEESNLLLFIKPSILEGHDS